MAAPVAALHISFNFRDAKGFVRKLRVIIGDASNAAIFTDAATLTGHLQAMSNGHVFKSTDANKGNFALGTAATYLDAEDKMVLVFRDPDGGLHRYQVPAPKSAGFLADQETVNSAETNVAAVITDFTTFVYGNQTDTSPLTYVGGSRQRRKQSRKFNIVTRDPSLTAPGE